MANKRLKTDIIWDNGNTSSLGKIDYETWVVIETLAIELALGNAVEIRVNDGMALSFPEKHSGQFKHVADRTPDAPLATKTRDGSR